jgi:hypothetical protein
MRVFIYTLGEPGVGEVRYVGQSVDPKARLASHLSDSAAGPVRTWIAFLRETGRSPVLSIVDEASKADADALEYKWIEYFRRPRLLNADRPEPVVPKPRKVAPPSGLADRVRALRVSRRLTQEQLAIRSGGLLTRNDVNKVECGLNKGRSHRIREGLATAFELDSSIMNAFLSGTVSAELLIEPPVREAS